jgi:glycosyltransferase involved in cell wall biosynthesis
VARKVISKFPEARVVVSGGNCRWTDVNWVHMVHAAWSGRDEAAPAWFRFKDRAVRHLDRQAERSALSSSRLIIANSQRTRRDLIDFLGIDAARIRVVLLGADPETFRPVTPDDRAAGRRWLGTPDDRPLVAFVGSLAHGYLKGFDTLLDSWRSLCAQRDWRADLIVAGAGRLGFWQREIGRLGIARRVRLLGHTERIPDLLAAADLLVSPSRYDAFGLNVQEALCRGVLAITTTRAGVSELYPPELAALVAPDPGDAGDLADRIQMSMDHSDQLRPAIDRLSATLRAYTWQHMARRIVEEIEAAGP